MIIWPIKDNRDIQSEDAIGHGKGFRWRPALHFHRTSAWRADWAITQRKRK